VLVRHFFTASIILGMLSLPSEGVACEINQYFFGTDIERIREQLGVAPSMLKISDKETLTVTGKQACRWSSDFHDLKIEFTFLYNQLVNIRLTRYPIDKPSLMIWARTQFGEFDDPGKGASLSTRNVQLFRDGSEKLLFYSIRPVRSAFEEMVEVTSKRHETLYQKYFIEVEQVLEGGEVQ